MEFNNNFFSFPPDFNSDNPYRILGLHEGATKREIKKAFNAIIKTYHQDRSHDKALTEKITDAKNRLLNPTSSDHDNLIVRPNAGALLYRFLTPSEVFKIKLKNWKYQGSFSDTIPFQKPPINNPEKSPFYTNVAHQAYYNLIYQDVPSLEQLLNLLSQNKIQPIQLPIIAEGLKQFLNSTKAYSPSSITPYRDNWSPFLKVRAEELNKISTQISAIDHELKKHPFIFTPPSQEEIDEALKLKAEIDAEYAVFPEKIFRTFKAILNQHTQLNSNTTTCHVINPTPDRLKKLGSIPIHQIKPIAKDRRDESTCKTCNKTLSLFQWMQKCTLCGHSSCSDCLQFRKFPEYQKPIRVCKSHGPSHYYQDWQNLIFDNPQQAGKLTKTYLLLLDVAGFANRQDFPSLAMNFIKAGSFDLAFQCYYSNGGDWLNLASVLCENKFYDKAWHALELMKTQSVSFTEEVLETLDPKEVSAYQVRDPRTKRLEDGSYQVYTRKKRISTRILNSSDWSAYAEKFSRSQPALALLCLRKAHCVDKDHLKESLKHYLAPLQQLILANAIQDPIQKDLLNCCLTEMLNEEKYASIRYEVLAFCYILENLTQEMWIQKINALEYSHVEPMLKLMDRNFKCDWKSITLKADRDHLRWPFLQNVTFEPWMDHLIKAALSPDNEVSVSYLLAQKPKEDFLERRDQYLRSGQWVKALICHRLKKDALSWPELAQKLQNNFPLASLLCHSLSEENIGNLGDRFFKEGKFLDALSCYLHQKDFSKISSQIKQLKKAEDRLIYQISLWKQTADPLEFKNLCQMLIAQKDLATLQKMMISALQENQKFDRFFCMQMLFQTNLSIAEKIGLLTEMTLFCGTKEVKEWHQSQLLAVQKTLEKMVLRAFMECSLKDLLNLCDLYNSLTWDMFDSILKEFTEDSTSGPYKSAFLFMQSLHFLHHPEGPQVWDAMQVLTKAMMNFSDEETLPFYVQLIKKIADLPPSSLMFQSGELAVLNFPNLSQFTGRLKGSSMIKLMELTEKTISQLTHKQSAMCYIDLQMALGADGSVGSCLSGSLELLKIMLHLKDPHKIYAYKKGIFELVHIAFSLAYFHLCPPTRLYTYKASIAILTTAFEKAKRINTEEQNLLTALHQEYERISKIMPLAFDLSSLFDTYYLNFINQKITSPYLKMMRDDPSQMHNPQWQYQIFSGIWQHWFDENEFDFKVERERTMKALLEEKGNSMSDVEALMKWPALIRDKDGWLAPEPLPLFLSEATFARVDGVSFNLETGEIAFTFTSSDDPMEQLFDMNDVRDILKGNITGAQFTLDQPDPDLLDHPFQEMRYAPEVLARTNYLATMLHADLLLKMLSMETEISAEPPFALRDIKSHLLNRLPEELKKKFEEYYETRHAHTAARAHRFWIQAGNLYFNKTRVGNIINYKFGECEMSVKKHLLKRDENGKLVDAPEDVEIEDVEYEKGNPKIPPDSTISGQKPRKKKTPETIFAELMTAEYTNLSKSFPELARLKELAKLQAIAQFAWEIDLSIKAHSSSIKIDDQAIHNLLNELRKAITYPTNAETLLDKHLKLNNVERHMLPSWQLQEEKRKMESLAKENDQKQVSELTTLLCQEFNVPPSYKSTLEMYVNIWLLSNQTDSLISLIKGYAESHKKQEVLNLYKINHTFSNTGMTFLKQPIGQDKCTWVPAAFKKNSGHRVYGGVNMNGTRVPCVPGGIGSTLPPRGPFVAIHQHRVVLHSNGTITGTNTRIDPVTGNPYQDLNPNTGTPYSNPSNYNALLIQGVVRDQWNAHKYNPTFSSYWQTGVGYTDTHHYTRHYHIDSVHFHKTNGYTTCLYNGESTVYKSGDKTHRCGAGCNHG